MTVLAKKNQYVLVKRQDGRKWPYAFGCEVFIKEGFPIDNCGTRTEIIDRCKSMIKLNKEYNNKYQENHEIDGKDGWLLLIKQNKEEIEALAEFVEVLSK